MLNAQFDTRRINTLKDILHRLRHHEQDESIQTVIDQFFKDVNPVEVLLIEQELLNDDYDITVEDIIQLSEMHPHLYDEALNKAEISMLNHPGHPIQIFKKENKAFQCTLYQINHLLATLEKDFQHEIKTKKLEKLNDLISRLGEFHNHYNRKEKLIFPIMERYGHYGPTRIMWRSDDRIRALYKGIKAQIEQLSDLDVTHVRTKYAAFEKEFNEMIFQEEALLLPILLSIFTEDDWYAIADESYAFGYALHEPKEAWKAMFNHRDESIKATSVVQADENIVFGGGYLTIEEANLVLNNLPLEITFVDKNMIFKYFNKMTEASDMMLVRTPISIGRNVANCHPPKSLSKVMKLIRDLKAKRRTVETMWFKMKGQYVHITYKGLFNEADEFLGILEYVQDIQPFFELPKEIKRELS